MTVTVLVLGSQSLTCRDFLSYLHPGKVIIQTELALHIRFHLGKFYDMVTIYLFQCDLGNPNQHKLELQVPRLVL